MVIRVGARVGDDHAPVDVVPAAVADVPGVDEVAPVAVVAGQYAAKGRHAHATVAGSETPASDRAVDG